MLEPCTGYEQPGREDGACPPTCVTCGCCAQAVEPVVLRSSARSTPPVADSQQRIPRLPRTNPATSCTSPNRASRSPSRPISFQFGPTRVGRRNSHAHGYEDRRGVRGRVSLRWAAAAQGRALTLPEVLARAREQAPQIVSARLALEEARGRLLGASVRFQANPQIDAALGNRNGPDSRFTDFELGLGQTFEPGARRSARIAGANAAIAQSAANIDEVTRTVLRAAASAYYRAVHANERIRLLNAALRAGVRVSTRSPIAASRPATSPCST